MKRTIIVAGNTSAALTRLQAARQKRQGVEALTIAQVVTRLAGGFLQPIDPDTLAEAAAKTVADMSAADLGDLHAIADLPGLPSAVATTLSKAWDAGIDLAKRAAGTPCDPRLATLARLEAEILRRLPPSMLRPSDLTRRAIERCDHAAAIFGHLELAPMLDIAPCWRLLLTVLQKTNPMEWQAGAYEIPDWWSARFPGRRYLAETEPKRRIVTCATARHEVIEAMRWARSLLSAGVQAQDIGFGAASPAEYDDLILAMAEEANLLVHFAHGRRALTTRDGQAAAALADILLQGLSQDRVRRLARLAHHEATPFGRLPEDWAAGLPRTAPLDTPARWRQAVIDQRAGAADTLFAAVDLLNGGVERAAEAGDTFLRGSARLLWRRALARAPASALESTLSELRLPDMVESATSVGWMHASTLATCPRPYVWLLGLNARTWPRASLEDALLPDHIIPSVELNPLPVTHTDRLAFRAIGGTTERELVCSASRRDATGRQMGLSPLLPHDVVPERLRRTRVPKHAMSEQDRMMARPAEFAGTARALSANGCWQDWNTPLPTAHDGQVRAGHPVLARALGRVHSASSLRMLLRNPLGFTWKYALDWREPESAGTSMDLDPMRFGNLVHAMLEAALPVIENAGGIGRASTQAIAAAVADARHRTAAHWEAEQSVPPALLWNIRLAEAEQLAVKALSWPMEAYTGQASHGELLFGDPKATPRNIPWDGSRAVTIPGTGLQIQGRIDRLDLAGDGGKARVVDYKTGKPRDPGTLDGGKELQRCLYAYAVQALLGPDVTVEAALLYPRGEAANYVPLADTGTALATLTDGLLRARDSLQAGRALPGPDTGDTYDDFAFALPAGPAALTERKKMAAKELLGEAARIWEQA